MEQLNVQGVGNGSQACKFKLACPIAIPHTDGKSHLHRITTPIVEGSGAELPGLLGLRSLETDRAILDTDERVLHFPGPGDVEINLPPGSVSIPLEKAPSGHLVIPIDNYEQVTGSTGGLKEHSLQFPIMVKPRDNKEEEINSNKLGTEPMDGPKGRCGMPRDICNARPCMKADRCRPPFRDCSCAVALRDEDCLNNKPTKPKFVCTAPCDDNRYLFQM